MKIKIIDVDEYKVKEFSKLHQSKTSQLKRMSEYERNLRIKQLKNKYDNEKNKKKISKLKKARYEDFLQLTDNCTNDEEIVDKPINLHIFQLNILSINEHVNNLLVEQKYIRY